MKLSNLGKKVVINVNTGEMLGYIEDVELNPHTFQIQYLMVEDKVGIIGRLIPWFFKKKNIQVLVEYVDTIGDDVILIRNVKK